MYRRPKFLEVLISIRQQMAAEADHDIYLFVEGARSETAAVGSGRYSIVEPRADTSQNGAGDQENSVSPKNPS